MNSENFIFFANNGFLITDVAENVDGHIYSPTEVNKIVADFGFQKGYRKKNVSIADIVGYDSEFHGNFDNIFDSMDYFFDEYGSLYQKRSTKMLEYSKDDIIEGLSSSFEIEPMSLIETGEGTYTVFTNGLHRYTLLRALYLCEASKVQGDEDALSALKEKYTIPANVQEIDLDKTYCAFLLDYVAGSGVKSINAEFDSMHNITSNAKVTFTDGTSKSLNNKELIELTDEKVKSEKLLPFIVQNYTKKYPSFKQFIDDNFDYLNKVPDINDVTRW